MHSDVTVLGASGLPAGTTVRALLAHTPTRTLWAATSRGVFAWSMPSASLHAHFADVDATHLATHGEEVAALTASIVVRWDARSLVRAETQSWPSTGAVPLAFALHPTRIVMGPAPVRLWREDYAEHALGCSARLADFAVSDDGAVLLEWTAFRTVSLYSLNDGQCLWRTRTEHTQPLGATVTATHVVWCEPSGHIVSVDRATGQRRSVRNDGAHAVTFGASTSGQGWALNADGDAWSTDGTHSPLAPLWKRWVKRPNRGLSPIVAGAVAADDGAWLATLHRRYGLIALAPETGRVLLGPSLHAGAVDRVQWSPSGSRILTVSSAAGELRVWNADSGECVHALEFDAPSRTAAIAPSGRLVALVQDDAVRLVEVDDGSTLALFDEPCTAAVFSPDSESVVLLSTTHEAVSLVRWSHRGGVFWRVTLRGYPSLTASELAPNPLQVFDDAVWLVVRNNTLVVTLSEGRVLAQHQGVRGQYGQTTAFQGIAPLTHTTESVVLGKLSQNQLPRGASEYATHLAALPTLDGIARWTNEVRKDATHLATSPMHSIGAVAYRHSQPFKAFDRGVRSRDRDPDTETAFPRAGAIGWYDLRTGDELAPTPAADPDAHVTAMAFSPDGARLAVGTAHGQLHLLARPIS